MTTTQSELPDNGKPKAAPRAKKEKDPKSASVTNKEVRDMFDRVLASNESLKGVQDTLTTDLLEAIDRINDLGSAMQNLYNKIDDLQINSEIIPEPEPAPKEYISVNGTSGFREGPAPVETDVPALSGNEYMTSREMFEKYNKQIARRDGELANKKFANLLEKICLLREDYIKLCRNFDSNPEASAKTILESFKAYLVDLENMINDAGVTFGHHGSEGDQVDTMHQRIVGVVNTDNPALNGVVAQRFSEEYEYEGRAIVKEKVNVYKTPEQTPAKTETGFRMSPSQ